jgi:hypothetical protein
MVAPEAMVVERDNPVWGADEHRSAGCARGVEDGAGSHDDIQT